MQKEEETPVEKISPTLTCEKTGEIVDFEKDCWKKDCFVECSAAYEIATKLKKALD
jgi:hypothetical protein